MLDSQNKMSNGANKYLSIDFNDVQKVQKQANRYQTPAQDQARSAGAQSSKTNLDVTASRVPGAGLNSDHHRRISVLLEEINSDDNDNFIADLEELRKSEGENDDFEAEDDEKLRVKVSKRDPENEAQAKESHSAQTRKSKGANAPLKSQLSKNLGHKEDQMILE